MVANKWWQSPFMTVYGVALYLTHRGDDATFRSMGRAARIMVPGVDHHITQRGNKRQEVFFAGEDRRVFLDLLHGQARKDGVSNTG